MPLTLLAHQAPVLPLKIVRPNWFDGTALCVGAAAPDLAYPLRDLLAVDAHSVEGVLTWGLGFTLIACWLLRRQVGSTTFAQIPDLGPFRLHSLRAITCRRPPWWQTVVSAVIGAASHVFIDSFTHFGRFGSSWLGLNESATTLPLVGEVTEARVLQYLGHTVGSLIGIGLLLHIGRHRLFERWYGKAVVQGARRFDLTLSARVWFWSVFASGFLVGAAWATGDRRALPFKILLALVGTGTLGSLLPVARPRRRSMADADAVSPIPSHRDG